MKTIASILIILAFNLAIGQTIATENPKITSNGDTRVEGIDELGAKVVVVYNSDLVKIYQERTADDVTTFAKYEDGNLVEYGTIHKPVVYANNKSPKSTPDPEE